MLPALPRLAVQPVVGQVLFRASLRRRVSQPLRAAAERCSAEPDLCARPPRDDETWVSFLPRPEPDLLPPPLPC